MKEEVEDRKNKIREAYSLYSIKVRQLWKKLLKKYNFDEQTAIAIVADLWYEPDNAEEFEEEWIEESDKIRNKIEKEFDVFIEHEGEVITVKNENFVYDGDLIVVEDE